MNHHSYLENADLNHLNHFLSKVELDVTGLEEESREVAANTLKRCFLKERQPIGILTENQLNTVCEILITAKNQENNIDLLLMMQHHPHFIRKIELTMASECLAYSLQSLKCFDDKKSPLSYEKLNSYAHFLDSLSSVLLKELKREFPVEEKQKLLRILKTSHPDIAKITHIAKKFQQLRFELLFPHHDNTQAAQSPQTLEVLKIILKTPDRELALRTIRFYKHTYPSKDINDKLKHLHTILEPLRNLAISDFKAAFIVEWSMEKTLSDNLFHQTSAKDFSALLQPVFHHFAKHPCIIRTLIFCFQRDLEFIFQTKPVLLQQALKLASCIFPYLIEVTEDDYDYMFKQIFHWTQQLDVKFEEARLLTRIDWKWTKTLAIKVWDDELNSAPEWIIASASRFCAVIFHHSSGFWLQYFSYPLIYALWQESLKPSFSPKDLHFDYVEFLVRALRKKSPLFASRTETLIILDVLNRLTTSDTVLLYSAESRHRNFFEMRYPMDTHEMKLWKERLTDPYFIEQYGDNPISQALHMLYSLTYDAHLVQIQPKFK